MESVFLYEYLSGRLHYQCCFIRSDVGRVCEQITMSFGPGSQFWRVLIMEMRPPRRAPFRGKHWKPLSHVNQIFYIRFQW